MSTETLMIPTVHLNGTDGDCLEYGFEDMARSVNNALDTLLRHAPNASDYYIQGPDAFRKAEEQHLARLARLRGVAEELGAIWWNVVCQNDDRRAPAKRDANRCS